MSVGTATTIPAASASAARSRSGGAHRRATSTRGRRARSSSTLAVPNPAPAGELERRRRLVGRDLDHDRAAAARARRAPRPRPPRSPRGRSARRRGPRMGRSRAPSGRALPTRARPGRAGWRRSGRSDPRARPGRAWYHSPCAELDPRRRLGGQRGAGCAAATSRAAGSLSVATTRNPVRSATSDRAITPEPVPRSAASTSAPGRLAAEAVELATGRGSRRARSPGAGRAPARRRRHLESCEIPSGRARAGAARRAARR